MYSIPERWVYALLPRSIRGPNGPASSRRTPQILNKHMLSGLLPGQGCNRCIKRFQCTNDSGQLVVRVMDSIELDTVLFWNMGY